MLTSSEIAALAKARERLAAIEGRLESDHERDFRDGRLAEACRAADEALMQVLIIAKASLSAAANVA